MYWQRNGHRIATDSSDSVPFRKRNCERLETWPETRAPFVIIIFNPAAGRRRVRLLWRVVDVLAENGVRVSIERTDSRGHAERLARRAASCGAKLVVAAGGDGTIAEVANGLSGSATRLGIIPLGTANVLARELGLSFAPRAVAAALAFGRTQRIFPGIARSAAGERLFVQMVGAGFDAAVVRHLPIPLKHAIGRSAYVLQSLREASRYKFTPIQVTLDGEPTEAGSVIVTKGRLYAGPFLLAPDASPARPGFTVALFDRSGPLAALAYGAALPLDLLPSMPGLRLTHAEEVDIIAVGIPTQADGDPSGETPVRLTDAPSPIDVVVG
jgi:YegS/Rv2252/BmrU family lipid kinase